MVSHRSRPTFEEELFFWNKDYKYIAGVDEVGRGCFAGPVVSAAVILPRNFDQITSEINDSKLLTPRKREVLSEVIKKHALAYAISLVDVGVINKYGIGKATQISFRKATKTLPLQPDFILVDAFYIQGVSRDKQKPIIHGDRKSISIAAASILAKVYRDDLMRKLDVKYLAYDFATNKGYGTRRHQEAIRQFGLSKLHRTSFDLSKHTMSLPRG